MNESVYQFNEPSLVVDLKVIPILSVSRSMSYSNIHGPTTNNYNYGHVEELESPSVAAEVLTHKHQTSTTTKYLFQLFAVVQIVEVVEVVEVFIV